MVHHFNPALECGQVGEQVAEKVVGKLVRWEVERAASSAEQWLGFDYVIKRDGVRALLEVKTDMRAVETGNLAIELNHVYSDDKPNRPGWLYSSVAHYLAYVLIAKEDVQAQRECRARLLLFDFPHLRQHALRRWMGCRKTRAENARYYAENLLVRVDEVTSTDALLLDLDVNVDFS